MSDKKPARFDESSLEEFVDNFNTDPPYPAPPGSVRAEVEAHDVSARTAPTDTTQPVGDLVRRGEPGQENAGRAEHAAAGGGSGTAGGSATAGSDDPAGSPRALEVDGVLATEKEPSPDRSVAPATDEYADSGRDLDSRLSPNLGHSAGSSSGTADELGLNGWSGPLAGRAAIGEPDAEPSPTGDTDAVVTHAPGGGGVAAASSDGDPVDPDRLRSAVEAVLLVVDVPTSATVLAQVLQRSVPEIDAALRSLRDEYDAGGRGLDLREVADGWRLYSRDEFAVYVERFVLDGQQARLSQAALETLAVIAYRQPVTRSRISGIRGVSVDAVMRTLLTRGLVEECGADPDTGGGLYRTTRLFLEKLGLRSLEELPSLAPLLPDTSQLDDVAIST